MNVTFATLIYTDGTHSTYGVFRGRLRGKGERQSISLRTARQVGVVKHERSAGLFDYRKAAESYETLAYPAFNWEEVTHVD